MVEESGDEVQLPRVSKGKRPRFFEDPAIDQIMTFFLELMAEASALHERIDTIERLLGEKGSLTRDEIENYRPTPATEAERSAWSQAFVARVLRFHDPE